jgi:hypothetical protein
VLLALLLLIVLPCDADEGKFDEVVVALDADLTVLVCLTMTVAELLVGLGPLRTQSSPAAGAFLATATAVGSPLAASAAFRFLLLLGGPIKVNPQE